jgi:hypothetical protein
MVEPQVIDLPVIDVRVFKARTTDETYKPHGVYVIVTPNSDQQVAVEFLDLWCRLEWSRWTDQRMEAVLATAPTDTVAVTARQCRNGRIWYELGDEVKAAWAKRIKKALREIKRFELKLKPARKLLRIQVNAYLAAEVAG